ncbi:MAG: MFS transporter [Anaerohalosphaera sp.]|nr:MFS transporter [Anaerohalosphaera sp.]
MDFKIYLIVSTLMFLEFAIWGAWSPVLATRLLGPLKMNGKQTGWIYATIPLACIVSPLVAGMVADRWIATERILLTAHLVGGVLLLVASKKKTFGSLFTVMMLYSLCYAATLPLVNSLMFTELGKYYSEAEKGVKSANIFIWAPVAWMLAGLGLTVWRRFKGTGDGSDCLKLGGILSLVMAGFCLLLPHTPPPGTGVPFVKAFEMLGDSTVIAFLLISFVVTTQIWFYFLGTAQYLGDLGIKPSNVPAVMTIAQIAQIVFTLFAFGYVLENLGFKWALTGGVVCWLVMYVLYSLKKPVGLVVGSMAFHGIAYVLFIIGGQIYVDSVAAPEIRSSAQAFLFAVTMGFGFFLGTQFTGIVMDKFSTEGKFNWRPIFLVPCVLTLICVITFLLFFNP